MGIQPYVVYLSSSAHSNWKEPVKVEIDHFADCIISGDKCITDSEHAARVVDILSRD